MAYKRRKFYHMKSPARFKFMRFVIGAMLAAFLVNSAIVLKMFSDNIYMPNVGLYTYFIIQLNFLGIMIVFVITLLWILHHGFGALGRMENILEQIINGDYSFRMHLRKTDIMHPFAEKLNKILDILEKSRAKQQ
ncbi:MAG: hypothetical protein JW867_00585 [Candidatus Omnitrophica bacterium]|nr:hypothetical protein [Candidatus Omnitrophota bacterium]